MAHSHAHGHSHDFYGHHRVARVHAPLNGADWELHQREKELDGVLNDKA